MTDDVRPLPETHLHDMLADLLRKDVPTEDFWLFVAAVAQGRGISERLALSGLEAQTKAAEIVPPAGETPDDVAIRGLRAFNLTVLQQLLLDMDAMGGPSILPRGFLAPVLCADISAMLAGADGQGRGRPQLLRSLWDSNHFLEGLGRDRFVGAVHFEAARQGGVRPSKLLSAFGARSLNASTWRSWVKAAGQELIATAVAAGKAGNLASKWNLNERQRAELWKLVAPALKK